MGLPKKRVKGIGVTESECSVNAEEYRVYQIVMPKVGLAMMAAIRSFLHGGAQQVVGVR